MLLVLCLDLFLAGSKTTIDTLATAFLFLSLNPEWVKKLQSDLDRVVGRSRAPTEDDLPSLPMIEAFLTEVINWYEIDEIKKKWNIYNYRVYKGNIYNT